MTRASRFVGPMLGVMLLGSGCAALSPAPAPPVPPRAAEADRVPSPPAEAQRPSEADARILAELSELQNAVARLIATSRRQDEQVTALERRLTELAERQAQGDVPLGFAPSGLGAAAPSSAPAPATMASAADLYASGMARLRERDYDTAILVLSELVSNYPTHPLRENAQVTVADVYYLQKDYRGAVAEFERLLDAVPKGARTPEVLVKLGLSRRGLGDEAGARKAWQRVITDHGKTDAARQARELLRTTPRS